jgi:hypothetical protein
MRKSVPILLSVTVILIISLACGGVPGAPVPVTGPGTLDSNAIGTVIVQTMDSASTQTAGAIIPVEIVNSPTITQTSTPEAPTLTPTATLSPMPLFTSTPSVPMISVSKDTNCRVGPGQAYDRVGALMVGEVAEVVGSDPTTRYWYIQNPDQANGYCWVWTEYATLSGNVSALPVFTPPPTPTPAPDFEAAYDGIESCSSWWVNIQLTNTGGVTFKSIALTVKDLNTEDSLSMYADKFTALDGCHGSSTKDVLNPEERFTVSTPAFAYDPKGHKLRATITMCSAAGQKGTCVTKVVKLNI